MSVTSGKSLPNKPSALILLALKDLGKVERSKKYRVNMEFWHQPNGKCRVCFAGSVMAKTLKVSPKVIAGPGSGFCQDTYKKLVALNHFRKGGLEGALSNMNISFPSGLPLWVPISDYNSRSSKSKVAFKKDMYDMVKLLEWHKL